MDRADPKAVLGVSTCKSGFHYGFGNFPEKPTLFPQQIACIKFGEFAQFPNVMKQTTDNAPNLSIVVGDRLYANRPACREVISHGAALYSLPKSNATLRVHGVFDWKRMTYEFILDPQGFLDTYHYRSISETINSMMKRREPIPIRKRPSWRKGTAETLKINVHNLRQSCYLRYLAPSTTKVPLRAS